LGIRPLSVKETEALVPEISFTDIISSLAPHDYKGDRLIVGIEASSTTSAKAWMIFHCKKSRMVSLGVSFKRTDNAFNMKALSVLLKDTPRETILLFLQWKIIQAFAEVVEDASIEPLRRFENVKLG
jgi:endothelin-converting enzyme